VRSTSALKRKLGGNNRDRATLRSSADPYSLTGFSEFPTTSASTVGKRGSAMIIVLRTTAHIQFLCDFLATWLPQCPTHAYLWNRGK
jgi:hypothetical protein